VDSPVIWLCSLDTAKTHHNVPESLPHKIRIIIVVSAAMWGSGSKGIQGVLRQQDGSGGGGGGGADEDDVEYTGDHVQPWELNQSQALENAAEQEEEEARLRVEAYINDLEEEVVELRDKNDGRELAMQTLESTVSMQSSTIKQLQEELDEVRNASSASAAAGQAEAASAAAAVTGREASSKLSAEEEATQRRIRMLQAEVADIHNKREEGEERLRADNDRLKARLREKKKLVVTMTKKLSECQMYIKELTDELERLYKKGGKCHTPDTVDKASRSGRR